MARLFQKVEVHDILQFGATEQGGQLVGDDFPQRVHADAVEVSFLRIKLWRAIHDDIHKLSLIATREPKTVKVRGGAQGLAVCFDFSRDTMHEVLYFDPLNLVAGEKIQIVRAAMIEIKQPQSTATSEKKTLFLREPGAEKITFQRRAGVRFFPAHERRGGDVPRRDDDGQAWG